MLRLLGLAALVGGCRAAGPRRGLLGGSSDSQGASSTLRLSMLSAYPEAVCNDGTPAGAPPRLWVVWGTVGRGDPFGGMFQAARGAAPPPRD